MSSTSPPTQPPEGSPPSGGQGRSDGEPPPPAAQEFRTYRRLLSSAVLAFISLGSLYLLVSVGVSIYRQRHPMLDGKPLSTRVTHEELVQCWTDLSEVSTDLQKRFENLHNLLEGDNAQSWANEVYRWRERWRVLGERCRLAAGVAPGRPKELENMAAAYNQLAEMEAVYTKDLLRFGKELAPQLDRLRKQIDIIGQRLDREQAPPGEQTQ